MITNIKSNIRKKIQILFLFLAKITRTNLTILGYYQKGISLYGDTEKTGENFVIEDILKKEIKKEKPIFFDVGSNIGEYSLLLNKNFPHSSIHSFEPNKNTYKKIIEKALLCQNIKFYNIGLGANAGDELLYDHRGESGTEHASIYKAVFKDLHHSNNIEEVHFKKETLDLFCNNNKIEEIDFLKIDTEGSEFDVLKGSKEMITSNKIHIIQFEFNEMNVVSRVFLKDYYDLLINYDIYRVKQNGLISLPSYNTENEIFKYQNFLAINKFYTTRS